MSIEERLVFVVEAGQGGRVDRFVGSCFPQASRKRLAALFADGQVRVDGKRVKKGAMIREGQSLALLRPPESDEDLRPRPEDVALDIVFEDAHLLAINKAAGTPSYPLRSGELGTVANAVVARFPECGAVGDDPREAGLAHRLDVATSGLILVARDQETWRSLRAAFGRGEIAKRYWAAVHGLPIGTECQEPLLQQGRRVLIDYAGLDAHTSWSVLSRGELFSVLSCVTHTGRMHQVRAHLAHCDGPIVGDTLYGGVEQPAFVGHFLHAEHLQLHHPATGEELRIHGDLPGDRRAWLDSYQLSTTDSQTEDQNQ